MSDYKGARLVLDALPNAASLIADRGYDSAWFREELLTRGIKPCIPSSKSRKKPYPYDKTLYRQRHKVESLFAKLKATFMAGLLPLAFGRARCPTDVRQSCQARHGFGLKDRCGGSQPCSGYCFARFSLASAPQGPRARLHWRASALCGNVIGSASVIFITTECLLLL